MVGRGGRKKEEERGKDRERWKKRRESLDSVLFVPPLLPILSLLFNFILPKFCILSSSGNTFLASSPFSTGCFSSPWHSQHLSWCYICYVQLLRVTLLMDYVKQGAIFFCSQSYFHHLGYILTMFFLHRINNNS